jgi:hydroxyacylglutathione hydrolase
MTEVAPGLWRLAGFPPHWINIYLADGILIDGGTRFARYRILRQLQQFLTRSGRTLELVALTHCHPDHQGAVRAVCQRWGVPLACHEADAAAMEGRQPMLPRNVIVGLGAQLLAGPAHPVTRRLRDGDLVGEFRVIHAPGHTPGQVFYFRERDSIILAGDVLANLGPLRLGFLFPGLVEPPTFFSSDPEENRRSIRKLLELRPRLICFGHGPPLQDLSILKRFVERRL